MAFFFSDTVRRILAEATHHPLGLATPPGTLPAAARTAVLRSLLKQGMLAEHVTPVVRHPVATASAPLPAYCSPLERHRRSSASPTPSQPCAPPCRAAPPQSPAPARVSAAKAQSSRNFSKRGIQVNVLERVRQVGPNKVGAKGSYTVYRVAEAG